MNVSTTLQSMSKKAKGFVKHNAPTILTCVGAAGVVATAVSTAKATTKASKLLEVIEMEKGEELTLSEKIQVVTPFYIPAVLFGVATITCIFGANHLNQRKQASLIGAYAMLDKSFKDYKEKLKEIYGKETHNDIIDEIVRDAAKEEDIDISEEDGKELFYDLYSGRYFESTLVDVMKAENETNKILSLDVGVGVNEFYKLVGLEEIPEYKYVGWSVSQMQDTYWHAWIEFEHRKVVMDDGLECTIIELPLEPLADFLEY